MNKKYVITNFGCQMNYADGERFAAIIEQIPGYSQGDKLEDADLLILNSCSVRQKAEDRILGLGRIMTRLKENKPDLKIVLTGCMSRRSWKESNRDKSAIQMNSIDREEELKKVMPWVDLILESKYFFKLPKLLGHDLQSETMEYLSFKPIVRSTFQAYIPISVGCDHFCTYCIVPFARGQEVCRDAQDIIREFKEFVKKGYKDITILGQTVNRYVNPKFDEEYKKGRVGNTRIEDLNQKLMNKLSDEPRDFLQLLQVLDSVEGEYWITFVSSHPNYMTSQLIEFIASSKHIRPYLHFALQSGSDAVLKRMNRRYSAQEFSKTAKLMKRKIPGLALSTDIIVGFPGESAADLKETVRLMQELEFDMAYLSEYSLRKGTAAGLIPDDIPNTVKASRKQFLNDEVLAVTALKNNKKMIGKVVKSLIEKKLKDNKYLARTGNYKEISFKADKLLAAGEFVNLKVTDCTPWALKGEPVTD